MKTILLIFTLFFEFGALAVPAPRPVSRNLSPDDAKTFYLAVSTLGTKRQQNPWQPHDPTDTASDAALPLKIVSFDCWGDFSNGNPPTCFIYWKSFGSGPGETYKGFQVPNSYQIAYIDEITDPILVEEFSTKVLQGHGVLQTSEMKDIYDVNGKVIDRQPVLRIECGPSAASSVKTCRLTFYF
jgi:hypothetical protein